MPILLDILYCTLALYVAIGVLFAALSRVELVWKSEVKTFRDRVEVVIEALYKFLRMYAMIIFFWPFILKSMTRGGQSGIGYELSSEDDEKEKE